MSKVRYSEFVARIDVDRLEEAIGFEVLREDRGNDIGHCVFPENHSHGDTTGKFAIHRDMRVYNCWNCGGGSLLSLVMELYDMDVDEATTWLFQFTEANSVSGRSALEWRDYLMSMIGDVEERVATMPYFNARVLTRFTGSRDYFRSRGISDEVIEAYNLCYGDYVMKPAPLKNGEKIDDDYYGPVAVFPHYWSDKLVGWQHRWMEWDEARTRVPRWLAKYTNTTDFPKHNTLFNYSAALKADRPVVVVESVPTVLFLASYDIPAVSYFGGQPKVEQLRLLRRFQQGVILAPDNDKLGDEFVRIATAYLERYVLLYLADKVDLGPKADLGDYAQHGGYAALRHHLKHCTHKHGVTL